ncbi:hypothetical protein BUALT_Bualt06G0002800 [Buddleja alternifolia]|uniref:Ubiquitin-like domain-containing protein n=1 Tax=Buddleja alternifolia TaxID=168488 RepID=A0AAV6XG03_9LAMI|nr:hypothetical protein BUALT_Bualt06G0002800 [Buddleja alternifolia]
MEEEEYSPSNHHSSNHQSSLPDNGVLINISIHNGSDRVFRYRIKRDVPLQRLMIDYSRRLGINHKTIRFIYDGRRVKESTTPHDMDMEDGAVIDALSEQSGGGVPVQWQLAMLFHPSQNCAAITVLATVVMLPVMAAASLPSSVTSLAIAFSLTRQLYNFKDNSQRRKSASSPSINPNVRQRLF